MEHQADRLLTEEWRKQGLRVVEEADHTFVLYQHGQEIGRYNQHSVDINNILREIQIGRYRN